MKISIRSIFSIITIIALMSGCASVTTIRSVPEGAKVYVDGAYMGKTPYEYSDTAVSGSSKEVKLEKSGFKTSYHTMRRNEELNVAALVTGIFVWIPLLWVVGYKPSYNYELQAEKQNNNKK